MYPVLNWLSEPVELCTELVEVSWQVLVNEELALQLVPFLGLTGGIGNLSIDFSNTEVRHHYSACCSPPLYCSWNKMYGQEQNTESSQVLPFVLVAEIGCQNKFNRETSNFNLKSLICSSAKKCNYLSIEVGLNLRGVEG